MAISKFPKTIFVTIEKDEHGDDDWLHAEMSQNDIGAVIGEEQKIAEYRLITVKSFKGVLKEI